MAIRALNSPDHEDHRDDEETQIHLPPLPAPLLQMNARTLQSVVTLIARDLHIDWAGEAPSWWPKDVLFSSPRKVPATCKGTWCTSLRKVIRAGYQHTGTNIETEEFELKTESDMEIDGVEEESGGFSVGSINYKLTQQLVTNQTPLSPLPSTPQPHKPTTVHPSVHYHQPLSPTALYH